MSLKTHSKFKNTGIIFELLVRQIASDTLAGKDCKAIEIINEHFKKGTELNKELYLYNVLLKTKYDSKDKADMLISATLDSRKKLNQSDLRRQRYNVIKSIKENYVLDEFVKSKINNYRELASIYQLFESAIGNITPIDIVTSKCTLLEHITSKKVEESSIRTSLINEYEKLDKESRLLTYKILIDSFNAKYKTLSARQKTLLREYINNISDNTKLSEYIKSEIKTIKEELSNSVKLIEDQIVKIKVKEIIKQLNPILENKGKVKDSHIKTLMKFYELIDEIKKTISIKE